MIFLGFGFLLSQTGLMPHADAEASLHLVAEIALIVLLFLDAAQLNLYALLKRHAWRAGCWLSACCYRSHSAHSR